MLMLKKVVDCTSKMDKFPKITSFQMFRVSFRDSADCPPMWSWPSLGVATSTLWRWHLVGLLRNPITLFLFLLQGNKFWIFSPASRPPISKPIHLPKGGNQGQKVSIECFQSWSGWHMAWLCPEIEHSSSPLINTGAFCQGELQSQNSVCLF